MHDITEGLDKVVKCHGWHLQLKEKYHISLHWQSIRKTETFVIPFAFSLTRYGKQATQDDPLQQWKGFKFGLWLFPFVLCVQEIQYRALPEPHAWGLKCLV